MNWWRKLYPKGQANPTRSMLGCGLAYVVFLGLCIGLLYLLGAVYRPPGTPPDSKPAEGVEQVQDI